MVYTQIHNYLSNNKPVIASITTNYGADRSHTCVVYGETYSYADPASTKEYLVHMGYYGSPSDNHVFLYHGWFDECGYLQ